MPGLSSRAQRGICAALVLTLGCATMWDWFEDKLVRRD